MARFAAIGGGSAPRLWPEVEPVRVTPVLRHQFGLDPKLLDDVRSVAEVTFVGLLRLGNDKRLRGALEQVYQLIRVVEFGALDAMDFAELRGYGYHTGAVFAAFVPGQGQEVARGGRYDDIERVYGEPRAATGFSSDLKTLVSLAVDEHAQEPSLIEAPWSDDRKMLAAVEALRAAGERVVFALPADAPPKSRPADVGRRLCLDGDGDWVVMNIVEQLPK